MRQDAAGVHWLAPHMAAGGGTYSPLGVEEIMDRLRHGSGGLDRGKMSCIQLEKFRTGNLLRHRFDDRLRSQPIVPSSCDQCGTGDFRQFAGDILGGQHTVDGRETARIVVEPSGSELAKYVGVVAHDQAGRNSRGWSSTTPRMPPASTAATRAPKSVGASSADTPRSRDHAGPGAAARSGLRTAKCTRANRGTDRDAGQCDLAGQVQRIQQRLQVVALPCRSR